MRTLRLIYTFGLSIFLATAASAQNAEGYLVSGNAKLAAKDYDAAIENYSKAIEMNPNYAEAYFARGRAKFDMQSCQCGTDDFDMAIKNNPGYADAYAARAIVYTCMNDTATAAKDIQQALAIDKNDAMAYMARGYYEIMMNQNGDAVSDLNKAMKLRPELKKTAYYYRGLANLGMNRFNMAKRDFNRSLKMEPQKDVLLSRADAWLNLGRPNKAIQDYNSYLKMEPNNEPVRFTKAMVLMDTKKYKESVAELSQLINEHPYHADYWMARGLAEAKMKNYSSAVADLSIADTMHEQVPVATSTPEQAFSASVDSISMGSTGGKTCASCSTNSQMSMDKYNELIKLDDDYRNEAYYYKCMALNKTGQQTSACSDCARALKVGYKGAKKYTPKVCTRESSASAK